VILVGHSIAGEELTGFGVSYHDRCEALIYLDAAYDRRQQRVVEGIGQVAMAGPASNDRCGLCVAAAVKAYYERTDGVRMTDGDARAVFRFDSAGRLRI